MIILLGVLLEIVNLSKDFYNVTITTMTLKNWLLVAAGIWGLALTWVGAFAMNNNAPTNEALDTKKPQMVREIWSWDMMEFKDPHVQLDNLTANLSDEDKEAVETLLTQFREGKKSFFEKLDAATTDEEKTSVQEEWEATKTSIKESILAIVWEDNLAVEEIFSRGHRNELWGEKDGEMRNFEKWRQWMRETREKNWFVEWEGQNPAFQNWEMPNFMDGERPELPDLENGERPEFPEMNGKRPQFWEPRGEMKGTLQGEQ